MHIVQRDVALLRGHHLKALPCHPIMDPVSVHRGASVDLALIVHADETVPLRVVKGDLSVASHNRHESFIVPAGGEWIPPITAVLLHSLAGHSHIVLVIMVPYGHRLSTEHKGFCSRGLRNLLEVELLVVPVAGYVPESSAYIAANQGSSLVHLHEPLDGGIEDRIMAIAHVLESEALQVPVAWHLVGVDLRASGHAPVPLHLHKAAKVHAVEANLLVAEVNALEALPRPGDRKIAHPPFIGALQTVVLPASHTRVVLVPMVPKDDGLPHAPVGRILIGR
mmetsp:Transcript_563/g.1113  ORF Transcript_563/g.1113 Transcript_563/m.1113 type:complete len:280 (-) Transcript_563:1075-1914(-)